MAFVVGDFQFESEEEAKMAQKEAQAIAYVVKQIDMDKPESVLAAYVQMIEKDLFHTELGITFLEDLRTNLLQIPGLENRGIPEVPRRQTKNARMNDVAVETREEDPHKKQNRRSSQTKKVTAKQEHKELIKYKRINHFLTVACITMLLVILGMFYIASTSNSPTILNYEEKIVNKYASWEEELRAKEIELNKKEQQLKK